MVAGPAMSGGGCGSSGIHAWVQEEKAWGSEPGCLQDTPFPTFYRSAGRTDPLMGPHASQLP